MKIAECKAICVFRGNGKLILTDTHLTWNKTAASYILFGAMAALTENCVSIPLADIAGVEKYRFLEGGGMKVTIRTGEVIKFSIKPRKAFVAVYDYVRGYLEQNRMEG